MLQVATFAVGVVAVFIGIRALVKGEVSLYATKKLRNSSARIAGLATLICGLGILVFAWLGFSWLLDGGATSTSIASQRAETTQTNAQWIREQSPDSVCSVEFPGVPRKEEFDLGGTKLHKLTFQREAGQGFFSLSYFRQPDEAPIGNANEMLNNMRENNLRAAVPGGGQFKLISDSKIEKDGVAGLLLDMQAGPDRVSLNRIFVAGRDVYRLNVVIDAKRKDDKDALRFLESAQFKRQ